jgi:DNA-binding transcriptional LysR family regulator
VIDVEDIIGGVLPCHQHIVSKDRLPIRHGLGKMPSMANTRVLQETAVRYFLEVVRNGSITKAAEKLNVASSAVSRQIARLEEELGTPLFDRRARGTVPNAAGELLASYALRMQLETDRIGNELLALEGLRRGEVKIACNSGFAVHFLPTLIELFRRRHSGIHFHLSVGPTSEVKARLLDGEADIGVSFNLSATSGVKVHYAQTAPIYAVMKPSHPLAASQQVTLADVAAYPLALSAKKIAMRQLIDACCARKHLVIDPVFTSDSLEATISFVLAEGGIAFSAELPVRHLLKEGSLKAIPVHERNLGSFQLEVQTLAGRILPRAVQAFLDSLIAAMPERAAQGNADGVPAEKDTA